MTRCGSPNRVIMEEKDRHENGNLQTNTIPIFITAGQNFFFFAINQLIENEDY